MHSRDWFWVPLGTHQLLAHYILCSTGITSGWYRGNRADMRHRTLASKIPCTFHVNSLTSLNGSVRAFTSTRMLFSTLGWAVKDATWQFIQVDWSQDSQQGTVEWPWRRYCRSYFSTSMILIMSLLFQSNKQVVSGEPLLFLDVGSPWWEIFLLLS